jgi:hypothetical protein
MDRSIDEMTRTYRFGQRQHVPAHAQDRVGRDGKRYRAAVSRLQAARGRALDYLRRADVPADQLFSYLSCAQRLYRLGREQFCLTMVNEARVLTNYWAARGMDPKVLAGVCREVLGFAPGEPGERPCGACNRRRGCRLCESVTPSRVEGSLK